MPKSTTSTPAGSCARPGGPRPRRRTVVAEEDVADPGHQDALGRPAAPRVSQRLDLVGGEEEAVADLAVLAEVTARVVLDRDRELHDALHALDQLLDDRGPALERHVEDVGPRLGRRRTRLRRRSSTPSTVTASGAGRSSCSQ